MTAPTPRRKYEPMNPLCPQGVYCPSCGTRLSDNGSKVEFSSVRPCPLGCGDEGES